MPQKTDAEFLTNQVKFSTPARSVGDETLP